MGHRVYFSSYFNLIWKPELGSGKCSEIKHYLPCSSILSSQKEETVITSDWKISCYSWKLFVFILSWRWEPTVAIFYLILLKDLTIASRNISKFLFLTFYRSLSLNFHPLFQHFISRSWPPIEWYIFPAYPPLLFSNKNMTNIEGGLKNMASFQLFL